MKYCVEIKPSDASPKAYWHTKEFATRADAEAEMERHKESDREYGQEGMWNYRISRIKEEDHGA